MRLFSALVPPPVAVDHLAERLAGHPADVRWTPVHRWHVTLGFFGDDDDPANRIPWLRDRVEGLAAPTLRLAGAGTFPGVLWAGVDAVDESVFAELATAAGADPVGFRPHLTLAYPRPHKVTLAAILAGYGGPWFTPTEVALLRSETGRDGPTYTTMARLTLARA
jgi:2'-5' RNA ligase